MRDLNEEFRDYQERIESIEAELERVKAENAQLKSRVDKLLDACEFVGAMMYRAKSDFYDKIRAIIENPNWPQEGGKD